MAVLRKILTALTLQSSATNSAGGTTTGSAVNVAELLGVGVTLRITNGGTGPSVECQARIYVRWASGGTAYLFRTGFGSRTNSAVATFTFEIPDGAFEIYSEFTGNTGQSVTVEAFGSGYKITDA